MKMGGETRNVISSVAALRPHTYQNGTTSSASAPARLQQPNISTTVGCEISSKKGRFAETIKYRYQTNINTDRKPESL